MSDKKQYCRVFIHPAKIPIIYFSADQEKNLLFQCYLAQQKSGPAFKNDNNLNANVNKTGAECVSR